MAATRVDGGFVTLMHNDPLGGVCNRASGLGLERPLSEEALDRVIAFARDEGAPCLVVQLSRMRTRQTGYPSSNHEGSHPAPRGPSSWTARTPFPNRTTTHTLRSSTPTAGTSSRAHWRPASAWRPTVPPMPGCQSSRAAGSAPYQGAVESAPAVLRKGGGRSRDGSGVAEHPADCDELPVSPDSVAVPRLASDAAGLGCRWVATETGSGTAEAPNPAVISLEHAGLTRVYLRRNWIGRPPSACEHWSWPSRRRWSPMGRVAQ
jgi:hypothetical protein